MFLLALDRKHNSTSQQSHERYRDNIDDPFGLPVKLFSAKGGYLGVWLSTMLGRPWIFAHIICQYDNSRGGDDLRVEKESMTL